MKTCNTCGKEIANDARFCTYCGALTAQNAATTQTEPQQSAPQQSAPQQSAPQQSAPQQSAPQQSAPQQSAPQQSAPQQSAPQQSAPQQSAPQQSAPQQSAPQQSAPQQSAPQQSAPQSTAMPDYPAAPAAPAKQAISYRGAPMSYAQQNFSSAYRPLGAWAYFGLSLLFSVPLVGFIFMIVFACDDSAINRRNFARSYLIRLCFVVLGLLIIGGLLFCLIDRFAIFGNFPLYHSGVSHAFQSSLF